MANIQVNCLSNDISKVNKRTGLTVFEENVLSNIEHFSSRFELDYRIINYLKQLKGKGVLPEKFNEFIQ